MPTKDDESNEKCITDSESRYRAGIPLATRSGDRLLRLSDGTSVNTTAIVEHLTQQARQRR